jgi:hypothetical protein
MAILYTCLSYLNEGLTEDQLKESLICLQRLGPMVQQSIYNEWLSSVEEDVPQDAFAKFNSVLKVDVSNQVLLDTMYPFLYRTMEVVGFWLNNFVFCKETYQFPSKRATSAWHLVSPTSDVIGFSGTDDNRFLLPLSVQQITPEEETIRGTNGEMIELILKRVQSIHILEERSDDEPLWQTVLGKCVKLTTHALIDVAGLMAGIKNSDAAIWFAKNVATECDFPRGVVYFETQDNTWVVFEMQSKLTVPLRRSSLNEADCFVYYDESRCRGSDMKLRADAVALVTLEAKLTKDKFLQGCARMRALASGQSLILAGTSEVLNQTSTTTQVLEKIIHNTAMKAKEGVLTFYERGRDYYSFPKPLDEDVSLQGMYAGHITEYESLSCFFDASHEIENALSGERLDLRDYCCDIGDGLVVRSGNLGEECEREVENEAENEEEEELEVDRQDPYTQEDWGYAAAFENPSSLFGSVFIPLSEFISRRLEAVSSIQWSSKVYCTSNFWKTVLNSESSANLSFYLRPVNAFLVMRDHRVVLISAYELDKLLPHWWGVSPRRRAEPKCTIQHLFTTTTGTGFGYDQRVIPVDILASIKLFRGSVKFTKDEMKELQKMFLSLSPRAVIQELLFMRDRLSFFERSDLDDFATLFDSAASQSPSRKGKQE